MSVILNKIANTFVYFLRCRSCDGTSFMTSSNGMQIDQVITMQKYVTSQSQSIPDQIQRLQQHLAQLQMYQEAQLKPGLNCVYNPVIAAYSEQKNENSSDFLESPKHSHEQMEAIMSRNSDIPFIDDPPSDSSVKIEMENGSNGKSVGGASGKFVSSPFPPQKGHIVKLHRCKKGSKHKNGKSKQALGYLHFPDVISNSNVEEFQDTGQDIWPKRRQPKNELLNNLNEHSQEAFVVDYGNGALHLSDYTQVRDSLRQQRERQQGTEIDQDDSFSVDRVSASEIFSLCVPVTPDSDGELTDKLEVLSTNSSFTSQLSPNESKTNNSGHVIANPGTDLSPWASVCCEKEGRDSSWMRTTRNHTLPCTFETNASNKQRLPLDLVHKNCAVLDRQNDMASSKMSPSPTTMTSYHRKPITSVKPLPKEPSSSHPSAHILPTKSPKLPIARILCKKNSDSTCAHMADSTV